jgi:tetratricopeptide (TPR) repeat protein
MHDDGTDETITGPAPSGSPSRKRLGDFDLVREIGRGGMGIVYEARQVSLNRRVALKLLPPGLGLTGKAVSRFRREAQAAARLHHTNIVPVYATGEESGQHYYAMEMIDGESLAQVLEDLSGRGGSPWLEATVTQVAGPPPAGERGAQPATSSGISIGSSAEERRWFETAAHLISEVADALHYAHGQGVVHRDIKPGNLMLARAGRLCITDFGLARLAEEPAMTMSGLLLGSRYGRRGLIAARRAGPMRRAAKLVRRHPLAAVAILALAAVAAAGVYGWDASRRAAAERAGRCFLDAQLAHGRGDRREALASVEAALAIDADLPAARLLRAELLIGLGRRAEATAEATEMVDEDPDNLTAHLILARAAVTGTERSDHWRRIEERFPPQALETAEAYYLRSFMAEDAAKALESLDRALDLDPGHARALTARANRLLGKQRFPEALADCDRLISARPDSAGARRLKANVLLQSGQDARARDEIERAIELDPQDPESFLLRGRLQCSGDTKSLQGALADMDEAVRLGPVRARFYNMRAWCNQQFRRYEETVADARQAIALGEKANDVYDRLASALHRLGRDEEAREVAAEYEQIVSAWKGFAGYQTLASFYLENLEDPESALRAADRAVELAGSAWWPHLVRARIRKILNDEDGFEADCDAVAAAEVEGAAPLRDRSIELSGVCGRFDEAIADLDRAIVLVPGWHSAWLERGWAKVRAGRPDEGLPDYAKAIELAPTFLRALNGRAYVLTTLGRWEEALADFDRAIAVEPNRFAICNRASVLVYLRRNREAKAGLERCLEYDPNAASVLVNLGTTCSSLGEQEEAISYLLRAREVDPEEAYVHVNLARVRAIRGECDAAAGDLATARELGLEETDKENHIWALLFEMPYFCPDLADLALAEAQIRELSREPGWEDSFGVHEGVVWYRRGEYERARSILRDYVAAHRWNRLEGLIVLAMAERRLGREAEARATYQRALEELAGSEAGAEPVIQRMRDEAARLLAP